jgi:hypothetical protein
MRLLAEAVDLDPENEMAAGFLELAAEKVRLLSTSGERGADQETASTEKARVHLLFDAPIKKGLFRLTLDDSPLAEVPFQFSRVKGRRGGRVEEAIDLPAGRHSLKVALMDSGDDALGEKSFEERFDPGTEWTLRVSMARDDDPPSFYLVLRR